MFESYSDQELKKTKRLFELLRNPLTPLFTRLVTNIPIILDLPLVQALFKKHIFNYFCGGENWQEVEACAEKLRAQGLLSSLSYSVESKQSETDYEKTYKAVMQVLENSKNYPHIPLYLLKVTGLGRFGLFEKIHRGEKLSSEEEQEWKRVETRVANICQKAADCKLKIMIDAEETWIQKPLDLLTEQAMATHNRTEAVVYNTYQIYLSQKYAQLQADLEHAKSGGYILGVKLVRGAYIEKETARAKASGQPNPLQPDKAACDKDYNAALAWCFENIQYLALYIGSHNRHSVELACQLMQKYGIARDDKRVYFGQLLGMCDVLSSDLAEGGYLVTKYIPYGTLSEVIPYLLRRIEENSSVKGQALDEINLRKAELKRRRYGKNSNFRKVSELY